VLTYHVVPGRGARADHTKQIEMGHGAVALKTVSGDMLWATVQGRDIFVRDEKGSVAKLTQVNVFQSSGVIHVNRSPAELSSRQQGPGAGLPPLRPPAPGHVALTD
jgi:hypothetical protein